MKNILTLISVTSITALVACSSGATRLVTSLPGAGSAQAKTYAARCGNCHAVPHPRRLSFQGWQNVLPVMEQRMKEQKMTTLNTDDKQTILKYLKAYGR